MIIIDEQKAKKVEKWQDNEIHILTDFDRTITVGNSESSWSVLSKSNDVPKEYVLERQQLYEIYRPYEIDETISNDEKNDKMIEWWNKHISLFVKYNLSEEVINNAAKDLRVMEFRDGAKEFLENMKKRNIPVIIISAGIGNFIEQFLIKNNCYFDNIHIIANFIKFENGIAVGVSENVIHSLNKNEVSLSEEIKELIKNRPNVILLGDSISDVKMVSEEKREAAFKIGFLEAKIEENESYFKEKFDVVCIDNESYFNLAELIPIILK